MTTTALPWLERQWRRMPYVDSHTGEISITRTMSLYFAFLVGRSVELNHGVITLNALWLALASLAAAFGKSTYTFILDKMRYRGEASQSDSTTNEVREIIDRRNRDQGIEATP